MNYLQHLTIYPRLSELAAKDRSQTAATAMMAMAMIEHEAALAVLRSLQEGVAENAGKQPADEFLNTFIQEAALQLEAVKEAITLYRQGDLGEQ